MADRDSKKWLWIAGAVMAVGLALRLWKAWTGHLSPHYDFGLSCLMTKHIAEGHEFPVFFYGQAYMGSLEPAISAVLCRLFGFSTFMVCVGTALVGALLLPLVYLWARDAAGSRRAGVMALLFCLVGSDTLFHYSVAPRGGYMTLMVLGTFSIWLATRIATRLARGETVRVRSYLALGLAAGLGWWSNQLVIVSLVAAAVILLCVCRWSMIRVGLLPALLAFFVGSAPWWIWNIHHEWATFSFGRSFGAVPLGEGFLAAGNLFLGLVELTALNDGWNDLRLALLAGMIMLFAVVLVRDRRQSPDSDRFYFRLAAAVLLVVAIVIPLTSRYITFRTSRYLLPMFPALAVMLGVGGDWLERRWRFPVGWIVIALLIPKHLYDLPRLPRDLATDRPYWTGAAELAETLGPRCDGVFLGEFISYHWMNLASGEKICVASLPKEKYAPYARRAELAERPAFLADYGAIGSFLRTTGGKSLQTQWRGIPVDHDLTPPPDDWRYVDPADLVSATDLSGASWRDPLVDGVADTRWSPVRDSKNGATLTFSFNRSVALCGIRLLSSLDRYPARLMVEGRSGDDGPWEVLLPITGMTGYFWSGRYVMTKGVQAFEELRFSVPTGGVDRVRLTVGTDDTPILVSVSEIFFQEQAPPPESGLLSIEACTAALRVNGVKQFYGPRWIADRVAPATKGEISVRVPSSIFRSVNEPPRKDSAAPYPIILRETTGFMMDVRDAARTRQWLAARGLSWDETRLGSYVLMVVPPPVESTDAARYPTLYWTEQGCLAADLGRFASRKAHVAYQQAIQRRESGDRAGMMEMLEKTLELCLTHEPARQALIEALAASGRREDAAAQEAVLKAQTVPPIPARIRFPGGVEFLGLTLPTLEVKRGELVEVRYHWRCPATMESKRAEVFVHFKQGKTIGFQDDHGLLEHMLRDDIRNQPFSEVLTERRFVRVPASTPPGDYEVRLGLYHSRSNTRLQPETDLPEKRREVRIPVVLRVGI